MGRMAAALLLMLGMAAGAHAQTLQQAAYGGSGEDILREVIACKDGLFAVGTTASDDYDLAMRTRRGETGWALRLDADGEVRFSYLSAHSGMTRMTAPAAFENGTYAVVLTDETGQRGEWILLDERGRLRSRMVLPEPSALCRHGGSIAQLLGTWTQAGPALAVFLAHEGGTCLALIAQDGSILKTSELAGEFAAAAHAGAEIACACLEAGGLCVHDTGEEAVRRIPVRDGQLAQIADMALCEDGSAVLCGGTDAGGGFVLRVSREGELLFFEETDAPADCLTETDTGFACLSGGEILFTDEDGGRLGAILAPENTLDLARSSFGAAALSHNAERGRRQAVFTHIPQPQAGEETQDYMARPAEIAAGEGYILCSAQDMLGVQVRHIAADGTQRFSTRTPIHTAADALEWLCAAVLEDGSVLLGGRYLTGEGESMHQQGVCALLTQSGVLRRMETIDGAGAVCGMEIMSDGTILLHAAKSGAASLEAKAALIYSLRADE